ncbi:MAG TPA: lipid-A-disaccharide synthase [Vicinamibacterales bacterium]|nr:lipid-A-disaccharide synthase [Vicinamibacterales bacterium]
MTRLLLSCGEASGDLYAGALVEALRRRDPDIDVFGLGGERFAAAGGRLIEDFHGLSVTGLTEAISVVPRSLRTLRRLVKAAGEQRPDAVVLIDYPDFNFFLMRRIKRLGIPIVYYITPQLWAWRPGRILALKRNVTRVLPIFPFEPAIYQRHKMDVRFVGHPLIDLAAPKLSREAFVRRMNLDPSKPVMALLPGSRTNELERLAPVIARALPAIASRVPGVQFIIARAPNLDDGLFEPFGVPKIALRIADGQTDDVLNACDAVITASGTATVQTALYGKPMVVLYKLSPLTYRLGIRLAKVDMYAMVNLIAGRRVVVELIQEACTSEAVADEAVRLMNDASYRDAMIASLDEVRRQLGGPGASDRAADAVLDVIHSKHAS